MAKKLAKKKSVTIKPRKKIKVSSSKKTPSVTKPYTKTELINHLSKLTDTHKKKVSEIIETLQSIIHGHLKGNHPFTLPSVLKVTINKKPATKSRKGINPFTGEPTVFKAKPARKVIKIKPLKKLKETV